MFGNDLNFMADKADKKMGEENLDVVAALMDVQTAEEGLLLTSANFDMLTTACENIEAGVALADAIAAKGDETSAVIVARESLRQNLKVLGQEHVVGMVVTPGTESITAATEGIGDMLKKAWAKTKEIAMKIWKWIVDLLSKVGHFLQSLVGKGDTTYERLVKLVKKHKDAKTTNLDGQEFSESVQKALMHKFKLLALSKDVSSSSLIKFTEDILKGIESDGKDKFLMTTDNLKVLAEALTSNINDGKITEGVDDLIETGLAAKLTSIEITDTHDFNISNDVQTAIKDKAESIIGDDTGANIEVLASTYSKVYCVSVSTKDNITDKVEAYKKSKEKSDFDNAKFLTAAIALFDCISVREFTVEPEAGDYEDEYKNIAPLEFSEVESIKTSLKDADKKSVKVIKNYGDKISKEKKDLDKVLKESETALNKDATDAKVKSVNAKARTLLGKVVNNLTKVAKASANARVNAAKEVVVSPVYDYCAESAKLYKKD